MDSDLCVIIPNYNYKRYLREAVASVLAQTAVPQQIIVTDDGSIDGSRDLLASLAQQWPERVEVLLFEHRGLVPTLNDVLARVRCTFFTVLAADDRWRPELAETATTALKESPQASLWHCDSMTIDGDGAVISQGAAGEWRRPAEGLALNGLLEGRLVVKGAYVLPTDLLRRIGGFDCRYPNEDWALFLRCASMGQVLFNDQKLCERRVHGKNWSTRTWSEGGREIDPTRYAAPEVMRELAPTEEIYHRALAAHFSPPVRQALHSGHWRKGLRLLRKLLKEYPVIAAPLVQAAMKGAVGAAWRAGPKRLLPRNLVERIRALRDGSVR